MKFCLALNGSSGYSQSALLLDSVKVFFCKLDGRSREQEQSDQVWNSHKAIEGLGDAPDEAKVNSGAQNCNQRVKHHEWLDGFGAKEEFRTARSV